MSRFEEQVSEIMYRHRNTGQRMSNKAIEDASQEIAKLSRGGGNKRWGVYTYDLAQEPIKLGFKSLTAAKAWWYGENSLDGKRVLSRQIDTGGYGQFPLSGKTAPVVIREEG